MKSADTPGTSEVDPALISTAAATAVVGAVSSKRRDFLLVSVAVVCISQFRTSGCCSFNMAAWELASKHGHACEHSCGVMLVSCLLFYLARLSPGPLNSLPHVAPQDFMLSKGRGLARKHTKGFTAEQSQAAWHRCFVSVHC